ncbi:DUF397 domain-containing protein [Plantactinospora sp. GCM10030261]
MDRKTSLRGSRDPADPALVFTPTAWRAFVTRSISR